MTPMKVDTLFFFLFPKPITGRWKWEPSPVFLSGKFHGQGNLAGYGPRGHTGCKESDITEHALN